MNNTSCSSNKTFKNFFTLDFINEIIQEGYDKQIRDKKYLMLFYLILKTILLVCGITLGYQLTIASPYKDSIRYFGLFCCCFLFISYLLYFIQLKYKKVTVPFLYFNLISIIMVGLYSVSYVKIIITDKLVIEYDLIIYSCYFTLIVSYIVFLDNNFLRVFVSLIINFAIYVFALVALKLEQIESLLINIGVSFLLHLVLYYFWCRISKESFYFQEKLEMQKNWIYDILNHWNSGVIVYNVSKQKVKFCNEYLKKYEEFQEKVEKPLEVKYSTSTSNLMVYELGGITEREYINTSQSYKKVDDKVELTNILFKNNFFRNLFDINEELPIELKQAFLTNEFEEIINMISEFYIYDNTENPFNKEFIFLGRLYLNYDNKKLLFELSMHGLSSNKGIYYEFMINDVTKTKLLEESIIKEKTLILGKISHEFKNPLIVVDEVVEQIIENKDNSNFNYLEKMSFIKNLCNYMIILVKDFEVVASLENNLKMDYSIDEIDLPHYLNEIEQIIGTLIEKKASNQIALKLNIDQNICKINTDSVRLKQILINLLSNSVKFTNLGTIELKVEILKMFSLAKDNINNEDNTENLTTDCKIPFISPAKDSPVYIYLLNKEKKHKLDEEIYIRFSIIDSGKGISDELINIINTEKKVLAIQKDNSSDNKLGTGYGLNIVQKLCNLLNSKLYTKRKENTNGSVFYFDIKQDNFKLKEIKEGINANINERNKKQLQTKVSSNNTFLPRSNTMNDNDFDVDNQNMFDDEQITVKSSIKHKPNIKSFDANEKLIYDKYDKNERHEKIPNSNLECDKYSLERNCLLSNLSVNSDKKIKTITFNKKNNLKNNQKYCSETTIQQNFDINLPKRFLYAEETKSINDNLNDKMKDNDRDNMVNKHVRVSKIKIAYNNLLNRL